MNRPYLVVDNETKKERLVEASSQSAAINYVVRNKYTASTPNAATVGRKMADGLMLESTEPQH